MTGKWPALRGRIRTVRGWTYWAMERYDQALADLNRAIELNPENASALASRGETYRLMERYDEALADFNRAIELDLGDDDYIMRHIGPAEPTVLQTAPSTKR
jgi:tetratricopeptide (TPR) repeat protein